MRCLGSVWSASAVPLADAGRPDSVIAGLGSRSAGSENPLALSATGCAANDTAELPWRPSMRGASAGPLACCRPAVVPAGAVCCHGVACPAGGAGPHGTVESGGGPARHV